MSTSEGQRRLDVWERKYVRQDWGGLDMYWEKMLGILGEGWWRGSCQVRGNGKGLKEVYGWAKRGHDSSGSDGVRRRGENRMETETPLWWPPTGAAERRSSHHWQWDSGTVGQWDSGTVGQWDSGTVGQWDSVTVGQWDSGTVGQYHTHQWQWDSETVGQQGQCAMTPTSRLMLESSRLRKAVSWVDMRASWAAVCSESPCCSRIAVCSQRSTSSLMAHCQHIADIHK